jgi:hypothetical protein
MYFGAYSFKHDAFRLLVCMQLGNYSFSSLMVDTAAPNPHGHILPWPIKAFRGDPAWKKNKPPVL